MTRAAAPCNAGELPYAAADSAIARVYKALNGVSNHEALNCGGPANGGSSTDDLATCLLLAAKRLVAVGIGSANGRVDYRALAESPALAEYVRLTRSLRAFDLRSLVTLNERKAFWINLYNALVIHAVITYRPSGSIRTVRAVFDRAAYVIGGMRFSANDIEHGILRANAGHPVLFQPQFVRDDPRHTFVLDTLDARVHFALNCAARSCPPIRFYDAERLDEQLDLAARSFLNGGGMVIKKTERTLYLSRIFSWYARDFGSALFGYRRADQLVRFAARYVDDVTLRQFLIHEVKNVRIRFLPYNWSLNG